MEKLEGKYFENVISKLKDAKDAERIEMRSEFRASLRSSLIEKAGLILPEKEGFNWSDAVLKWKYLFGAVPVLAVLVLVVTNVANFQVKIPRTEIIPENNAKVANVIVADNSAARTINADVAETAKLTTFSADAVMPPADLLAKIQAENNPEQTPDVANVNPDNAVQSLNSLSFDVGTADQIKLTAPQINVTNFKAENVLPVVNNDVAPVQNADSRLAADQIVAAPPQNKMALTAPVNNADTQNEIRPENSGRVEQSGMVQNSALTGSQSNDTAASNQINASQLTSLENVQGAAANKTVQSSDAVIQNSKIVVPNLINNTETYINPTSDIVQDGVQNKVSNFTMLNSLSPVLLNASRIIYDGADKDIVDSLVLHELADRNGNLMPDYTVKVVRLQDGKLEVTLYENGKVSRIVYMQKDAAQNYKAVTVINY